MKAIAVNRGSVPGENPVIMAVQRLVLGLVGRPEQALARQRLEAERERLYHQAVAGVMGMRNKGGAMRPRP